MKNNILILCAAIGLSTAQAEPSRYKVGISVPLSGPAENVGIDVRATIEFANDSLGKPFTLVIEDDKCSPKDAVTVAQSFINIHKVDFILGLPCSGAVLATAPIYDAAKKIVITSIASAPAISNAGNYIFRTRPDDSLGMQLLSKFIATQYQRLGVLSEQTEYGSLLAKELIHGIRLLKPTTEITHEEFLTGDPDQRSQLLRMKQQSIQAIMLAPQSESAFLGTLRQIRQQGLDWQVFGSMFPEAQSFRTAAKSFAEGLVFVSLPSIQDIGTSHDKRYYAQFVEKYGPLKTAENVFITTWASVAALHNAVRTGGSIREALQRNAFSSIGGSYSFDINGDLVGMQHVLNRIENQKVVAVKLP